MTRENAVACIKAFEDFCNKWDLMPEWIKSTDGVEVRIEVIAKGEITAEDILPLEEKRKPGRPKKIE